jgi:hypothetical protein
MGALDGLLRPRTYRVLTATGAARRPADPVVTTGACRRKARGPVDLAVVLAGGRRVKDAQVVLSPLPGGASPRGDGTQLVLGPGCALWTPRMSVGIDLDPHSRRGRGDPLLVMAQGGAIAEQVARAVGQRRLPLLAAVATGAAPDALWGRLIRGAAELRPRPTLLLALHAPLPAAVLLLVARSFGRVLVLLTGEAHRSPLAGRVPSEVSLGGGAALCRAIGLPVVRSVEELVEAAALVGGVPVDQPAGRVKAITEAEDEAALLADAMARAGLEPAGPDQEHDCVLLGPRARPPADGRVLRFDPTSDQLGPAGLGALAALVDWRVAPRPPGEEPRPRGLRRERAWRLLDGWAAELSEVQVKQVLACYGIQAPAEELVGSASRAGEAARRIGLPVAVKAVGPTLTSRAAGGALRLDVPSVSAARQAFRDVLQACQAMRPAPYLDGVLVSAMVELPSALECALLWPTSDDDLPPLLALRVRPRRSGDAGLLLPAPLPPRLAARAAEALAGMGLGREDPPNAARVRALAAFLRRLSWLGPDLSGRLRWLGMDCVSPPRKRGAPLVIDARGLQTESLRAPGYY